MKHFATARFWDAYEKLLPGVRRLADKNYALLKEDPRHPSLHFKQVGSYWTVRVGLRYRAIAIDDKGTLVWFWIGSHADYDALVREVRLL